MTTTVFDAELTATNQTISGVENTQFMVFVGGSGIAATNVTVAVKPPNGLDYFYDVYVFSDEDAQTIQVPKGSDIRFTIADASSGVNVECHPMV